MKTKKILAMILSIAIVFSSLTLVGCSFKSDVMGLVIDEECVYNKLPLVEYSEDTYQTTISNIQKLNDMVVKEEASDLSCQILSLLVSNELYKLIDAVNVATLYYYTDTSDEVNISGYLDLYDKYSTAFNEFKKLYSLFANSKYKTIFFGDDMTDEEIQELVSQAVVSDELVELEGKVVELEQRYDGFTVAQILGSDFDDLYTDLVKTKTAIAKIYGYDDYLTYSYENEYAREFTPADTLSYTEALSNGFVSAAEDAYDNCLNAIDGVSDARLDEIDAMLGSAFIEKESLTLLDGFYKTLGEDIYGVYNDFISNGYYFIANSKDAYQGAYTNYFVSLNTPYIYFSSSYATVETFVHEFGHYLRFFFMGNEDGSYELMETHSQGAEWLFVSYLSTILTENESAYLSDSKFVNDSYTIALCAVVGAAEVDVYSLENLDAVNYTQIVSNWSKKVFGNTIPEIYSGYTTPEQYFRLVTVNQAGYYISYSVSLVSSLELYVASLTSYENAVDIYVQLLETTEYVTTLTENGLYSPFSKEAVESICAVFENVY